MLKAAVIKIAVAALLVRYFPPKGSRHDAALALGGFLARAGWEVKDIGDFVENIRETAGIGNARGEDPTNLKTAAIDAAETHKRGEKNTYGLPGLQKFFGKATANAIAEWLEYQGEATYPLNLELAVKLWGEPSHKGKFNCQWGEDDTKKILNVIRGDWFDFEYNIGGGVRDLMKMLQARASNPDAAETSNNKALILQWHGDAPPAPQRWLIRNRLPETGAGLLVAQWGMYKTFCALDISAHVMMGWDWTGEPTYRQCGVLCIAKEGSSSIPMQTLRPWSNTLSSRVYAPNLKACLRSTPTTCLLHGPTIARCYSGLAKTIRFPFLKLQPEKHSDDLWINMACRSV